MALDEAKENWRMYRSVLYGVAMLIKAIKGLQRTDEVKEWLQRIDVKGVPSIATFSEAFKNVDETVFEHFKCNCAEYWSCHDSAKKEQMEAEIYKWTGY